MRLRIPPSRSLYSTYDLPVYVDTIFQKVNRVTPTLGFVLKVPSLLYTSLHTSLTFYIILSNTISSLLETLDVVGGTETSG